MAYARPTWREVGRVHRIALALAWAYPLLPPGALYATWAVAWMVLGRRPLPGPDDPGSIGLAVTLAGAIAGLLLITAPLGWLLGVGAGMIFTPWWIYSRGGRLVTSGFLVVVLLAWYAAAGAFLQRDPFGVMYWFMD